MTDALTEAPPRPDDVATVEVVTEPPPPSRPRGRIRRSWDAFLAMPIEGYVSLAIVAACVVFVFIQLGPGNILGDTTPAGGDMGAHVWGPAYLRDQLLPSGRLTGWTPDWYAGFPAYQFYMVIPSLAIALLSYVLPYGVAFKLVAISGVLSLPVCAWAFGRLTRLPFPVSPLLAIAATMYLFDRSFSILGGNIASTLAGEFAFSISLSFALLYLGVLGRGLENGKHRGWAAVLLALTGLCHLIPLFFALAGTVVWFVLTLSWRRLAPTALGVLAAVSAVIGLAVSAFTSIFSELPVGWVRALVLIGAAGVVVFSLAAMVVEFPRARLVYLATMLPVGGALTAFWLLPFYLRHGYMNDMGWEKKENYGNFLFSRDTLDPQLVDAPAIKWVLALAAVGGLMAIVYGYLERRRGGMFWLAMAVVSAVAFVLAPQGRLWNARLLPFYYLALYLLAAIGVAYVIRTLAMLVARDPARPVRGVNVAGALSALLVGLVLLALPLRAMPESVLGFDLVKTQPDGSYKWWFLPAVKDNSFVDSWAKWNFEGYENKQAYPDYYAIVNTMQQVGENDGCGRAMWEHEEEHNRFGTPMALMLLPFWTDGCIGSMEGLYFEASSTTPYHFINQDELSSAPSNAQRDLPYVAGVPSQAEFDLGVQHLQMLGVRYYMAISERMVDLGRKNDELKEVASTGPWVVFEVADSPLVEPLANQPAVLNGLPKNGADWLEPSMDWYMSPEQWPVYLAADGPPDWQRVDEGQRPDRVPEQQVTVTNVETGNDSISFDVSDAGTPILVKTSFFPNWQASGADGPWRVTPNLMVVVPTSNHVELHYGYTGVDYASWAITLVGLIGLVLLFRARPVVMPEPPEPRRLFPRREQPSEPLLFVGPSGEPIEGTPLWFDPDYRPEPPPGFESEEPGAPDT